MGMPEEGEERSGDEFETSAVSDRSSESNLSSSHIQTSDFARLHMVRGETKVE